MVEQPDISNDKIMNSFTIIVFIQNAYLNNKLFLIFAILRVEVGIEPTPNISQIFMLPLHYLYH